MFSIHKFSIQSLRMPSLIFFKRSLLIISLSFFLMNSTLMAATAPSTSLTLNWIPPIKRVDGSKFTINDFGYYTLHVLSQPDGLYATKVINDPYQTQLMIDNVERKKTYYFAIEITDNAGNSSELSPVTILKL